MARCNEGHEQIGNNRESANGETPAARDTPTSTQRNAPARVTQAFSVRMEHNGSSLAGWCYYCDGCSCGVNLLEVKRF